MRRRALQVVLAPVALLAAGATAAALPGAHGGAGARLALGTSAPLFAGADARDLRPGDRVVSCVTVRNAGDAAAAAALYAQDLEGTLAPFLELTVTRGRAGGPGCAGFVAHATVFAGRLSEFPARLADAVVDPATLAPGEERGLRFALALADAPAAAGRGVSWSWRLAVEAKPATAASRACTTARPAARRDVLRRTRRLSHRVHAVLVLRGLGRPGADRLVLTTGLRVRGRTLRIPRWARVDYRVNGRPLAPATARPFRVRVDPGALRPGTNRVTVTVRPRTGPARTTTFSVDAMRLGASCALR